MRIKPYIISAVILISFTHLIYFCHFYLRLKYPISSDPAAWGQFGDFAGGFLNPLLSFISIVLLIKSVSLQNDANSALKSEITANEKTEKLRSFEVLFFNLINSQKNLFDSFKLDAVKNDELTTLRGAKAVIYLEENISRLRASNASSKDIADFLSEIDDEDRIFSITRAFYITALIIDEKLCNETGFFKEDREAHLKALINFTDFAQLRLILISIQFLDYESTRYLINSEEFKETLHKLGLSCNLY